MTGQGQHRPDGTEPMSATVVVVICATLVVFGLLAAGVVLAYAGWEVTSIVGLLTAIGTVAGALLALLPKLVQLQQSVDQVRHQTDGALRAHITRTGDEIAARAAAQVLDALGTSALPPVLPPGGARPRPYPRGPRSSS